MCVRAQVCVHQCVYMVLFFLQIMRAFNLVFDIISCVLCTDRLHRIQHGRCCCCLFEWGGRRGSVHTHMPTQKTR